MRNIYINIQKFGLTAGDKINLQLINAIGKPLVTNSGYTLSQDITVGIENIEISLLENDNIFGKSLYKLTTPKSNFTFTIKSSKNNKSLDLVSLLIDGCIDFKIADDFIERFERYLLGLDANFTNSEQQFVDLYIYFADNVHGVDGVTNDLAEKFDIEIGSIGV